jgi:putative membrane protein
MMGSLMTAAVLLQADGVGMDHVGPWGGGWWWVWRLVMLIFWLVVGALVVRWFVRSGRRAERSGFDRAADILAERYARGEITVEEYRERLDQLQAMRRSNGSASSGQGIA